MTRTLARIEAEKQLVRREGSGLADEIERARDLEPVPDRPGLILTDFLATAPEEPECEIPRLLPKASRVVITGEEGAGKSTLGRFVAGRHAAGVHPFTGGALQLPPPRDLGSRGNRTAW